MSKLSVETYGLVLDGLDRLLWEVDNDEERREQILQAISEVEAIGTY